MQHARKLIVGAVACAAALLAAPTAQADPLIPGGKIYSTGGDVKVKIYPPSASYNSEIRLYLIDPIADILITTSQNPSSIGKTFTIANVAAGQELLFGIQVLNTGNLFLMGEAARNPDNVIHAKTEWTGANTVKVHFEDLHETKEKSDHDFNDVVFDVSGAITAAPAPAGLALMAIGGLGFGAARFVRRKKVEMV